MLLVSSKLATATLLLVVLFLVAQHHGVNGFGSFYKYNINRFGFTGDIQPATLGNALEIYINNPTGVCKIGGNIYYLDSGSNGGLKRVNLGTGLVESYQSAGGFSCSATHIYVYTGAQQILKFDPSSADPQVLVETCESQDFDENGDPIVIGLREGSLASACLSNPSATSWSETLSTLYLIDSNRIVSVSSTEVKIYAGNGACSSNSADIINKKPLLAPLCPTQVTTVNGKVFFVSSGSVYTIQNNAVVLFACSDAACQSSIKNISPSENGDALLLHTSDNTIRSISLTTRNVTIVAQNFSSDTNVYGFSSVGDNNYLFVASNFVKQINLTDSSVKTIAGLDFNAPFNVKYAYGSPKGVVLKGNDLIVADYFNKKIVKVDLTTKMLSTVVALDCDPTLLQINPDTGNLGFLCRISKTLLTWDVREYNFDKKVVTVLSKFTLKSPTALTYCSSTKTYYTLSTEGFCTTSSNTTSSGCEALASASGLSCYNGKIYYIDTSSANIKLKSWPVGASVNARSGSDALPASVSSYIGAYTNLYITPDGTFYPLSAGSIQRREEDALASVVIAGSSSANNGDGGLALSASLGNPTQIAVSPTQDRIYMVDTTGVYIRVLSPSGSCVSNIFIGSTCDILCSGIASSNYSNVCSGVGTCATTYDGNSYQATKCKCHEGTSGTQCEIFNCFGLSNKAPTVCSGQGKCVDVDLCKCYDGYQGNDCASMTCGGILASDPNVCNGTKCIGPNTCEPSCNGIPQSSPSSCSGEGTCISTNTCSCNYGRYGEECQFSNPCSSCENGGTCYFSQGIETCNCSYGYIGVNCSSIACGGISESSPHVCSGEGTCTAVDNCKCAYGRFGSLCERSESCKSLSCGSEQCIFQNGTETCLHRCGLYTMNETNVCSSRGDCIGPEQCECLDNWTGSNCEIPKCNGVAKNQPNACSGNGVCSNSGLNTYCSCSYGHTGVNCELFTCKNISEADNTTCLGRGSCIGSDKCKCNEASKWTGNNCEIPICFGISANDPSISTVCNDLPCIAPDTCDKLTESRPKFPYRYSRYMYSPIDYLNTLGFYTTKKFYSMEYNSGMLYISSTYSVFKVNTLTNTTTALLNINDFGITGVDAINYFIKTAVSKNGRYLYAVCKEYTASKVITFDLYYSKVIGVTSLTYVPKEVKLNSNNDQLFMDDSSKINAYSVTPIFNATSKVVVTDRWGGAEFTCFDISGDYLYLIRTNVGSNLKKYNLKTGTSTTINSGSFVSIRVSEDNFILGANGYMVNVWDQGNYWNTISGQKNMIDVVYLGDATALAYGSGNGFFLLQPNVTAGCYSDNYNPLASCVTSCDGILATNYSSVCNGNGYCTDTNKCTCKLGFDSTYNCAACNKVCNNSGVCTFNGTATSQYCKCSSLFTGESCETPKCSTKSDCLNSLIYTSGNIDCVDSKCVPYTCSSDSQCANQTAPGYTKCIGGVCAFECSDNSDCSNLYQDKKFCREFTLGYTYKKCDTECSTALQCKNITRPLCLNQQCSEVACKNETDCYSNGLSVCLNGTCSYECLVNSDCPLVDNYISTCGSDSTVKSELRKCVKKPITCFGLSFSDPKVCSGQGICTATNTCTCKDGHVGTSCAYSVCFGIPANNSLVCSGRGNCSNVDTCTCSTLYEGNQCEKLKQCSGQLECLNGGSCVYTQNGEVCNCVEPFLGKTCEKKSCTTKLNCSETTTCDLVKGYCVGINCTMNETCLAIGMHKCGVDGVCRYECETNSDCPYMTPYCNKDEKDKTKFKKCTIECLIDGDCAKFNKTNCGVNSKDPLTYQRCYNKECLDNDGCVSVSGRPRCDTSVFRCVSVGCFVDSDCAPYGYPHCNSNGSCAVECMVHDDCKVTGMRRCGMNPSNVNEYHKCVASCESGVNNCKVCAGDRLTCSVCNDGYAYNGNKCIPKCNNNSDCTDEIKTICDSNGLCKGLNCSSNADCIANGFSLCSVNGTCGFECMSNSDCKNEYLSICGTNKTNSSYRKCIGECRSDSDCNGYYGRPFCVTSGSSITPGGRCSKYPCYFDSQCSNFATNSKCICGGGDCYCRPECVQDSDCNTDQRRVCDSGLCTVKKCSNDTDCPYKGYSSCDPYNKYCKAECSSNTDCQLSSNNPLLNTCSKKDDMTLNRCVEGCKKDSDCLDGILSVCDVAHATCNYRYCTDNNNCTIQGYTSCGPQNNAGQTYCDKECSYDSYCAAKYTAKPICSKKIDSTLNTCVPECVQDIDCSGVVSKKKCSVESGRCVAKPCSTDGDCSELGYSFCGSAGVCTFECLGDSQCSSKFGKTKCNLNSNQATYQRCIPECLTDTDCSSISGRPKCNTTSKACESKSCSTSSDCGENGFTNCKDSKCVPECLNDRNCIGVVKSGYKTESCDVSKYSGSKGTCQSITAVSMACTSNSGCSLSGYPECKDGYCNRQCMYDSDCPSNRPYCDMTYGGGRCTNQPCLVNSDCTLKGFKQCYAKTCVQTECSGDYQCTKGVCITDYNNDLVNTCQSQCNATISCPSGKICKLDRCVDVSCNSNSDCSSYAPFTTCRNSVCKLECELDAHCSDPTNKFCDMYRNKCVGEIVCNLGCVNGTCYNNTKSGETKCNCNPGFIGSLCNILNETSCSLNCLNGGVCEKDKCICKTGFNGQLCQNIDQPCQLECQNGGSCVNTDGISKCQCLPNFIGNLCQNKSENPCTLQCGIHGTCVNATGLATCSCKDNFSGEKCSVCSSGFDNLDSLCICNLTSRVIENGACVCNQAAGYVSSNNNECIRKQPICSAECGVHGSCVYKDDKTTNTICKCESQWVSTDSAQCSDCDSSVGLILSNGKCICNTELGFTMNAQGKCIRNESPKCNVECGSNGVCEFESSTSTISVCKCKNGFVTVDPMKPCSACPSKTIQSGSNCICDVSSGFTTDPSGLCICNTLKGFKTNSTLGKCECNPEYGFTQNGMSCGCAIGYENQQGRCKESIPTCSSSCGNGVCQFDNIAISTSASCKCNKGFASKLGETPCSSCAPDYISINNICTRVCPVGFSGENCEIYSPSAECITLPSSSLSFCKSSIDYTVLNTLYINGAVNESNARVLLLRNAAKNDALAREQFNSLIKSYQEGQVCDEKCIATLTKFACYSVFQSCSKLTSVPLCKSVCEQVKSELSVVPSTLNGICNSFNSSNCFYGSYLPSDTSCFGLLYTDASVCSSLGKCTNKDTCVCSKGYTGSKCELNICFDKDSSNSQVCSGRGKCTGVNTCECNVGFTGPECQLSTCNGKLESEGGCSFRGSCSDSHTCSCYGNFDGAKCDTCKPGLTGANCDVPICNGVKSTDSSVCSGRGKCVIESNNPVCKCNTGYDGTSCQNFKCDGIDRNSANVCSGRGKCISYNTCVCSNSSFNAIKFCSECSPSFQGSECSERRCSDELTCSGHGKCDALYKCGCNGNWVGEFCNTCKSGFVGSDCQFECSSAINCNNRGSCNMDGSCTCQTHAFGAKCQSCENGWYGEKCDFSIDATSFGFTTLGDSIYGTVYSTLKKKFLCSELIVNHEILGTSAKCLLNGEKSTMEITLGPSASIVELSTLQFKNYFASSETINVIVTRKDYISIAPTASLKSEKSSISKACGSLYLDASGSVSLDRRSLIFSWSVTNAPTIDDSMALESLISTQGSSSGIKIVGQNLGIGSYSVQVTVTSTFSKDLQSTATVTFQVSDLTSPTVSIKEGLESSLVIGKTSVISPIVSFPSCYGGVGSLSYVYSLDTTKSVDSIVIKQNKEMLVFSNDFTKITIEGDYYFILTVSQQGAATVNIPFKVTARALPLLVSFSIRDLTQSIETPVIFNIEKQDPSNPTDTSGSISLSCSNLLTGDACFSPIIDDKVPFKFNRTMETGTFLFTAVFSKGSMNRISSTSVKITLLDQPKSKIIRVSIVPPVDCDTSVVDPSSDLILQASNQDVLSSLRIYTWSSSDMDLSTISTNLKYLQIPKTLLVPGASYKIVLKIIDGDKSGDADITFTVNSPPTIGILEINPKTGVALKDEFQIMVGNGWYDPQVPLSYEFLYKLSSESTWSKLSSKSEKKSMATSLPSGTLDIKVIVYDANGASSETITQITTTVPSPQEALSALTVSQQGSVTVSSISSALSVVGSVNTNTPQEKEALKAAGTAFVDKYFKQSDEQDALVSETSDSVASKISVISSIGGCVNNLADSTVSLSISKFSETTLTASNSESIKMNDQDIKNSENSASQFSSHISVKRIFTLDDMSRIEQIFNDLINVQIKNLVADMPAVKSSTGNGHVYARLVSISTLEGLTEQVDSNTNFNLTNTFTSMSEFNQVESVKLYYKTQSTSMKSVVSKIVEFSIFNNNQQMRLNHSQSIATITVEKLTSQRKLQATLIQKCFELQNGIYIQSTQCTIVSESDKIFTIETRSTGSFVVQLVSQLDPTASTNPEGSSVVIPIVVQKPNMDYVALILLVIPVVALISIIVASVYLILKRRGKSNQKNDISEKELMSI